MSARAALSRRPAAARGFTLLEMCIVLFLIALLAAAAMPALNSAFNERALRGDSHTFSVLVKTAMVRSSEDQRPYTLSLDGKELSLAPATATEEEAANLPDAPTPQTQTERIENTLKLPDATKPHVWDAVPALSWTFEPNGLCPLPRLRFERGASYIELDFNALTGDVEDEADYLP